MKGKKLINRRNLWKSNDEWNLRDEGEIFYIDNTSRKKVLAANNDIVNEENFVQEDVRQMWVKGVTNSEGFFTMINPQSQKVLTAISVDSLKMEGIYLF